MFSIEGIKSIIQQSRKDGRFCQYNDYKLKPIKHEGHLFWVDIKDGTIVYCHSQESIQIFKDKFGLNSKYQIQMIPSELINLIEAINNHVNIINQLPSSSLEIADFGSKLPFDFVFFMANNCYKHAEELYKFKEFKMAMETFRYGIKILTNWKRCNDFNKLNKTKQEKYCKLMGNSLHQMAIYQASSSNWQKTLVYAKQALTYIKTQKIKQFEQDTLIHIDKIKKFNNLTKNK